MNMPHVVRGKARGVMLCAMPRLLVVEDDPDTLDLFVLLLESGGFDVVGVTASAPAKVALARGAFDVVLADLLVETSDIEHSWQLIDEMVELAAPTPLGLVTGWSVNDDQRARHGLAFALLKPVSSEELLSQLAITLDVAPLSTERADVLRAYFASIERADWDALGALCTDDLVYHLPGSDPTFARLIRGRAAFLKFSRETFSTAFLEPKFEIRRLRTLHRGAVVEYVGRWRDRDGTPAELAGSVLFAFDGDRIAQIGVRIDLLQLRTGHRDS
jgi:CheY-like chemotaxis protein